MIGSLLRFSGAALKEYSEKLHLVYASTEKYLYYLIWYLELFGAGLCFA